MDYAAMTFWLVVIVFTALGVHQIWSSMIQPKIVNIVLLPGTLVAQLGYIIGLLITGGTVNDTALIKDDDSAEPKTDSNPKPRIPIVGTVVVALLPMAGCAAAIYWVSRYLGAHITEAMSEMSVQRIDLPTTLSLLFAMLHNVLNLIEELVRVIRSCDFKGWQTPLFLYLAVCLTVRMAPLTGNIRGSLGAIALTGVLAFIIGTVAGSAGGVPPSVWQLITFSVAALFLLLILSLLIKGVVSLIKTCAGQG